MISGATISGNQPPVVPNNVTIETRGGGIVNEGSLTIGNSATISNHNFSAAQYDSYGAGVYQDNANAVATITSPCIISGNSVTRDGAGINVAQGQMTINGVNLGRNNSPRAGAAVFVGGGATANISNCTGAGNGGQAIFYAPGARGQHMGNQVTMTTPANPGDAAVDIEGGTVSITGDLIQSNSTAGLLVNSGTGNVIQGVTITRNDGGDFLLNGGDVAAEGTGDGADVVGTFTETGGELKGSGLLTVNNAANWTGGIMDGSGVTHVNGSLAISGSVTLTNRLLENAGTGTWSGTIGGTNGTIDNQASGSFAGAGSFAGNLQNEGQLLPGGSGSPGNITLGGNFTHSSGTLVIDLGSAGSGSDSLTVSGAVRLGGNLSLNPLTGFGAPSYTIIRNVGGSPVNGTFQNLPEGWLVPVGGSDYTITYQGGSGSDVVLKALTTTTTLSSSENPAAVGDTVTFTAGVQSSASGGGPAMTGTVTFYDGSTVLGSASIGMSGSASLQVSSLLVGDHSITAVYSGDSVYPGSTSAALDETVNKRHMNMSLDAGGSSVPAGQTFTITAYLFGPPPPTGTVTFTLIDSLGNETTLGTYPVGSSPQVQMSTSIAAAGLYHIRADYSADGNYFSDTTTIDLTVTSS